MIIEKILCIIKIMKSIKEGLGNMEKETKRYKKRHLNNYRKVRGKYKEVGTRTLKVKIGDVFTLEENAIHETHFERNAEKGCYILKFYYHKMGKGQLKRSKTATYRVEEQAQGSPGLIRISTDESQETP